MPKDRYQASHEKWKKENMKLYAFRLSRVSEKDMMDFLAQKESVYAYIKDQIREDMDTERTWRICMGVATGAEYAKRYGWEPLHTQLWKLAVELGAKLGLDPGEVYRQAHQVQESERLY